MKYLSVDYGLKRVGLAVSDPGGRFAFPLKTLVRTTKDKLFADLLHTIQEENIEAIVLGLPTAPDGSTGGTAAQVRNFAASLARRVNLTITLIDETLSSEEAKSRWRSAGREGERKGLDAYAAAIILETHLSGSEK